MLLLRVAARLVPIQLGVEPADSHDQLIIGAYLSWVNQFNGLITNDKFCLTRFRGPGGAENTKRDGNYGSIPFWMWLERETGLEPATFCLEGRSSTN